MRDFFDTIFNPFVNWLTSISDKISSLSVPVARQLNLSNYLGYFSILGPTWTTVITTILALAFIYWVTYIIVANMGLLQKFINLIKFW